MRVTYYGQACTLVEAAGRKILTDPWLTEGAYFGTWFHTHILEQAGVTPATFPKDVDYIFLSHEHEDHVDPATLSHFPSNIPVLICKFPTPRFRHYLESLGLTNIKEIPSGQETNLAGGVSVTIFRTAEYTNDAAVLIEADGCRLLNETDCKLGYADLQRIGQKGIDIGFYMFSGANWYPMMYDYQEDVQRDLVRRRRQSLLKSLVQRVKLTKPRIAVPAAGPCTVLDPELLWLNSDDRGIFIDPEEAIAVLKSANLGVQPLYMAATDVWHTCSGIERRAPEHFRIPRQDYLRMASDLMARKIHADQAAQPPAGSDLPERLASYFNTLISEQSPAVRQHINAKLALLITGCRSGTWTIDFTSRGREYVRQGLDSDWTYKIEMEDKLLYPFLAGQQQFF